MTIELSEYVIDAIADAVVKKIQEPKTDTWSIKDVAKALEKHGFGRLEQEPKAGHWSHDGSHWENRWICSECGYKLFDEQTNYCPNCGADMRGEE